MILDIRSSKDSPKYVKKICKYDHNREAYYLIRGLQSNLYLTNPT